MVRTYSNLKQKRKVKVRSRMFGSVKKPRVSVFRSNKYIYAQAIDDEKGVTLAFDSSIKLDAKGKKIEIAFEVGQGLAKKLAVKKIKNIVFDRGPYKYHGNVKNIAEGLRKGGIEF